MQSPSCCCVSWPSLSIAWAPLSASILDRLIPRSLATARCPWSNNPMLETDANSFLAFLWPSLSSLVSSWARTVSLRHSFPSMLHTPAVSTSSWSFASAFSRLLDLSVSRDGNGAATLELPHERPLGHGGQGGFPVVQLVNDRHRVGVIRPALDC